MFDQAPTLPKNRTLALAVAVLMVGPLFTGCISGDSGDGVTLEQTGSSTVLPLAERWSDDFTGAQVSVSGGGSSHGINSMLTSEAHLGDASRKMNAGDYTDVGCDVSQDQIAQAQTGDHPWQYPECNGVTPTEWVVAYDALTVVVHPDNDWAQELTFEQLRQIFTTENTAETWDEVEGLEDAPDEEIEIFAPDEASGTYVDFFELINADPADSLLAAGSDRYSPSADDNVILNAIAGSENAIGFFGFAYYVENDDLVDAVAIQSDEADEHVEPSFDAEDYPITRPIHVYTDGIPDGSDATSETIQDYLRFSLGEGQRQVSDVGYFPVDDYAPTTHQSMMSQLR
jgi:phosphate transport system substrate-binding protein